MTLQLGKHSYGNIHVKVWSQPNVVVHSGAYCSFAGNIRIIVDGNHPTDTFTSYPFASLFPDVPPNNYGKGVPVIGNDVWIGEDATIHSGVTIGDGAVVAGQSVVSRSVPPYAIVAGNPARVVKYRFSPENIAGLLEVKWWELPEEFIRTLVPISKDIEAVIAACRNYRSTR